MAASACLRAAALLLLCVAAAMAACKDYKYRGGPDYPGQGINTDTMYMTNSVPSSITVGRKVYPAVIETWCDKLGVGIQCPSAVSCMSGICRGRCCPQSIFQYSHCPECSVSGTCARCDPGYLPPYCNSFDSLYYCPNGDNCIAKVGIGQSCTVDPHCLIGSCRGGRCCRKDGIGNACLACNTAGSCVQCGFGFSGVNCTACDSDKLFVNGSCVPMSAAATVIRSEVQGAEANGDEAQASSAGTKSSGPRRAAVGGAVCGTLAALVVIAAVVFNFRKKQ